MQQSLGLIKSLAYALRCCFTVILLYYVIVSEGGRKLNLAVAVQKNAEDKEISSTGTAYSNPTFQL